MKRIVIFMLLLCLGVFLGASALAGTGDSTAVAVKVYASPSDMMSLPDDLSFALVSMSTDHAYEVSPTLTGEPDMRVAPFESRSFQEKLSREESRQVPLTRATPDAASRWSRKR